MKNSKPIIQVTEIDTHNPVLIGVESIIKINSIERNKGEFITKIESRGAMVTTTYVYEEIEEIYDLIYC